MRLELGQPVRCSVAVFGELGDVVIDPTRRQVTHLVVQPHRQHHLARIVPIELVKRGGTTGEVALRCTTGELRRLAPVQEFTYLRLGELRLDDPDWDVGTQDVLALPYYNVVGLEPIPTEYETAVGMTYDRVPKGEVEIRRSSAVVSADEHQLGHVDGFLVDDEEQITHIVLEHGHLWGRREVTIPIGAVARVETDTVTVSLSKDQVEALPERPVERWPR